MSSKRRETFHYFCVFPHVAPQKKIHFQLLNEANGETQSLKKGRGITGDIVVLLFHNRLLWQQVGAAEAAPRRREANKEEGKFSV